MARWVLHVDLDQFIAAVEVQRRPELAGRPVVVGGRGDPTERGVVATASYEARERGVGSGTPLRVAARRCPDAVFLPVDKPAYDAVSARVMDALRGLGHPVQVLGWDEAFLGVDTADPERLAREVQGTVLEATGLHCSVGIGDNTLRAKTATGFGKPRGVFRIDAASWAEQMGQRPTTALWGIGTRTAARLADLGIETVAELAAADTAMLAERLGPTLGPWYRRLGRGASSAEVDPTPWVARGHGREETFQQDLTSSDDVERAVRSLAERVAEDLGREDRPAVRVGIKVRYRPFRTVSRSLTLPAPTSSATEVAEAAVRLLARLDPADAGRPVRLVGVRAEMAAGEGWDK